MDHEYVVSTVREHHRARRYARDVHGALLKPRKGTSGAVRVKQRDSGPRGPCGRDHSVHAGGLEAHQCAHVCLVQILQHPTQDPPLFSAQDPLVCELRRTDQPARDDQRVIRQVVEVHHRDRASVLHREERRQQGDLRVSASARSQ